LGGRKKKKGIWGGGNLCGESALSKSPVGSVLAERETLGEKGACRGEKATVKKRSNVTKRGPPWCPKKGEGSKAERSFLVRGRKKKSQRKKGEKIFGFGGSFAKVGGKEPGGWKKKGRL